MIKKILARLFRTSTAPQLVASSPANGYRPNHAAAINLRQNTDAFYKANDCVTLRRVSQTSVLSPGAKELLREGRFRIALVGFHADAFPVKVWCQHDSPQLDERITDLSTRVKTVSHRNIAAGLRVSLQLLSHTPGGRTGVVVLTSGQPSMKSTLAIDLIQTAIKWRTGIHVIGIGVEPEAQNALASLTTKLALGYGTFQSATTNDELIEALRGALDGLAPARGMRGVNSAAVLVDCSKKMVAPYQGTTRIEMVVGALRSHLRQPLIRPLEKKMALAA